MNAPLNNFGNLVAYFLGKYTSMSRGYSQGYTADKQAYVVTNPFGYNQSSAVFLDTNGNCNWLIEVTTKDKSSKFSVNDVHWYFPVGGDVVLVANAKNGRTVKSKSFNYDKALVNFYPDLKKLYNGEYPNNFLLTVLAIATNLTQEYNGYGLSAGEFFTAFNKFSVTGDTSVFDTLSFIEDE